jgi:hypothetical protein
LPPDAEVEDLSVDISPDGVAVNGKYPTPFMKVNFETLWTVAVQEGRCEVRLSNMKVAGLPATMLRGLLFKMLKDAAAREIGLQVRDDLIVVNCDEFLAAKQVPLRLNLKSVLCSLGSLVVEAGRVE